MCLLSQNEWGNMALSLACAGGYIETARVLLDHRAYVNYQNKVKSLKFVPSFELELPTEARDIAL